MRIFYADNKVEKYCTDLKAAQRKFPLEVAKTLQIVIKALQDAKNIKTITKMPRLNFHEIKGEYIYSIYLGKRTGFRLLVRPLNADMTLCSNEQIFGAMAVEIVNIRVEEVSKHYE